LPSRYKYRIVTNISSIKKLEKSFIPYLTKLYGDKKID